MQPAVLSLHIRWQIVEKTLEGLTTRQIAKHLGISKTSVGRVCQYYRKFGHVEIISLGRPRIFNSNDLKYLEVLLKERNTSFNDRTTFVLHMMQYTPNQLVFSDESAYDRQTLFRRYSWNKSGFRARSSCFFIRGRKYTIEAALCINEQTFYYIKNHLRKNKNWVESIEDPEDALDYACMQIDKDLARACYQHSGYMS
ncbi:hypothetical protein RhiirB3_392639 [Rhizophagus irregularis]|nr:hypothetical protein RhiirB3_392639 [Rhizophagus irregularis]